MVLYLVGLDRMGWLDRMDHRVGVGRNHLTVLTIQRSYIENLEQNDVSQCTDGPSDFCVGGYWWILVGHKGDDPSI